MRYTINLFFQERIGRPFTKIYNHFKDFGITAHILTTSSLYIIQEFASFFCLFWSKHVPDKPLAAGSSLAIRFLTSADTIASAIPMEAVAANNTNTTSHSSVNLSLLFCIANEFLHYLRFLCHPIHGPSLGNFTATSAIRFAFILT